MQMPVVSNLNQEMLNRAIGRHTDNHTVWQQADALKLPFEAEAVFCGFGVMFFTDRIAG